MSRARLVFKHSLDQKELDKMDPKLLEACKKIDAEKSSKMSPRGSLGLNDLLEERRFDYGITDGAFCVQPLMDQVLIYQISRNHTGVYEGTSIIMTSNAVRREQEQTPQGIIVAAGARALDTLRMNGIDLGHVVVFCRMSPWRVQTDSIGSKWEEVLVMQVGDIVGSVDLAEMLRSEEVKLVFNEEVYEHQYIDKDGNIWKPAKSPSFIAERY